jgi:(4S)-4-hydroxy-5-phosphonooxypentane-2,3-dione isomerase
MFALVATHKIQPQHREDFIKAIFDDAIGSIRNEVGCLRFDVMHDQTDPNTFYLFEAYVDKAAFEKHNTLPHFIKWRDAVKDWYVTPPTVQWCTPLFPSDTAWKKAKVALEQSI